MSAILLALDRGGLCIGVSKMSYRSFALATAMAALPLLHIASAAAQSVYVAPGGIYISAGAGPIYATPSALFAIP
jgi:hypothetical protein